MKLRLSQDEEKVVDLLRKSGALAPSEISVQTLMGPGEMKKVLHDLEDLGYVVLRTSATVADAGGTVGFGPGLVSWSTTHFGSAGIDPGETWALQAWYRDAASACAGGTNLTQALAITFE